MEAIEWRRRFPRNVKPTYDQLLAFLPEQVRALFLKFDGAMNSEYRVYNKWHRFEQSAGWVYGYCRNYRCELLSVSIGDGCFYVFGEQITDEGSLNRALQKAKEAYDGGYEARYARLTAEKKAKQIERTKVRVAREKEQIEQVKEIIDPEKFNRFKWTPKVSRRRLLQLYNGEAQGRLDEELLDDIGFTFYSRCKQAEDTREHMDRGLLICHNCGAVLSPGSYTGAVTCACGYSYTYREYRRSCNAANMPGGRATPVFRDFAERWPLCRGGKAKMLLIDWLVHECHVTVMSGARGRTVCANLIEGTLPQLREMLETLAGHWQ